MFRFRLVSIVVLAAAAIAGTAIAGERQLRLDSQFPPGSPVWKNLESFATKVKAATKGELLIVLVDDSKREEAEIDRAVAAGTIEIAAIPLAYFDTAIPAIAIFEEPFVFYTDSLRISATAPGSAVRAPLDEAILQAKQQRTLYWQPLGTSVFVSKTGPPVLAPAALAGKRAHADSESQGEFIKACGGIPSISSDVHDRELLEKGEVDIIDTSLDRIEALKLWDVAKAMALTHHEVFENIVFVSEAVWQSLNKDQQEALRSAALAAEKELRDGETAINESIVAAARKAGMEIAEIGSNDVAAWKRCDTDALELFLSQSGALGRRVIDGYRKLIVAN